jgi:FtsP/CotA-like multicopper oxidase with cupredoxin domain
MTIRSDHVRLPFGRRSALLIAVIAIVALSALHGAGQRSSSSGPERIAVNDNRHPGGSLVGNALTIRLEARMGQWFPDGDDQPGLIVKAFAVEGGPLQIPGPLVRVPEGTQVRAVVHNRLADTLAVHGMYSRSGPSPTDTDAVVIPPGGTREFTFMAGRPGTYYYWASTKADTPIEQRLGADTQLSGAFVVDPRGSEIPADRVLVIGGWLNVLNASPDRRIRWVINGLSWPHTERLSYSVGETVRMRVINTSVGVHPMHLHGFYFNVESRGDERQDTVFAADASPHLVVTERLAFGRTFALTWKPTRPGNWLFHCHDSAHLDYGGPLDRSGPAPVDPHRHVENHATEMMAGPVTGISVTGASIEAPEASVERRRVRLVARVDKDGTDAEPAFGYTLGNENVESPYLPGPTLLLKRGEPVSITVVNQLPEPTAVHWHGIELESFYDGVPGFAGDTARIAPAIAPGESFEARFTPPRSGTFIYHAHVDDRRQQQAGLSGPLLVVDSLDAYDPTHDLVMMITTPRKNPQTNVVLINGSLTPAVRQLRAGDHYRLRFINLHIARPSMRMRLLRADTLLTWRSVAKDGMDLPLDQVRSGPSEIQMGNGETYDFDFVSAERGDIRLDVTNAGGVLLASMPLHVQ